MVQLTLPENSRVKPGKTWPKPASATRLTEFRIYRWNPDLHQRPSSIGRPAPHRSAQSEVAPQ